MNTINNFDFDALFNDNDNNNDNDNLSDEFYSKDFIRREKTDQYAREISLMEIELKDLKIENQKIDVLTIKYNMLVGHNKQLCYELKKLQKENKKLKKRIRPNLVRRMWRKLKNVGYNKM